MVLPDLTFYISGGRRQAQLAGGRLLDGRVRPQWTTHGIRLRIRLGPPNACSTTKTGFHNLAMKGSDDQYVGPAQEVVAMDDG